MNLRGKKRRDSPGQMQRMVSDRLGAATTRVYKPIFSISGAKLEKTFVHPAGQTKRYLRQPIKPRFSYAGRRRGRGGEGVGWAESKEPFWLVSHFPDNI